MSGIQTVLGIISKKQFGFCHSHEHLFIAPGIPADQNPALRIDDFSKTREELLTFKKIGGCSVVDAQPIGCGRMADLLIEVSQDTGIQVVASTGFHKRSFYPSDHWIFRFNEKKITDIFINEIEQGMYLNTEYQEPSIQSIGKAGVIKTAIDTDQLDMISKKLLNSAAQASMQTGIPLLCHIENHRQGFVIAEYFMKLGISPQNIIICHMDRDLRDIKVHKYLAEYGVFLEYDTIGRYKYHDDREEAMLINQMLDWGFQHSLLLGLDTTRNRLKSYGGEIGLEYIIMNFLPILRQYGISEKDITCMMIKNPSEAFSMKLKKKKKE